jgi:hypothetical protein
MAEKRWSAEFDDPIHLEDGRQLLTLRDAARYIQNLPPAEQTKLHWQTATSILITVAEGRDFVMHARIAMLRAINHGRPAAVEPRRKRVKAFKIIR